MRTFGIMAVPAALLASACAAAAEPAPTVGQERLVIRSYETARTGDDGSSGSSRGRDALLERVVGARDGGLELEYDLPPGAGAEDRARSWRFPLRVFRPAAGPPQVLNAGELQARADRWLAAAGLNRAACGRWYFTWNAFQVECDPQSALKLVEAFDLRADLRDGAAYQEPGARGPGTLRRTAGLRGGAAFTVVLEPDPEAVRRARAETDVAVGEMANRPTSLEAALRERAEERVSGTISITYDMDASGGVRRRTKVTKLEITGPDGRETETVTETVERRPVSALSPSS